MNIKLKSSSKFPQNLLEFKDYDGAKVLVVFLFLLALAFFFISLIPTPTHHGLIEAISNLVKPLTSTISFVSHLFFLFITYCLMWLTFDPKNFESYAIPALSAGFALLYMISPLDFIPDLPVFGYMDDFLVGGTSILLGFKNWVGNKINNEKLKSAINFANEGKPDIALRLLLENQGAVYEEVD